MSRFVLDCALSRPVSDQTAQWLVAAVQRAWAVPSAGYHEGKVSDALLKGSESDMAQVFGAAGCTFEPTLRLAVSTAVADAVQSGLHTAVVTTATDPLELQLGCRQSAASLGLDFDVLPVTRAGRVDPAALAAIGTPVVLAGAAGNQEIGSVQSDISDWASTTGSALVWDISTTLGWAALPSTWDSMVMDPRAWGAPAGACAVVSAARPVARRSFENPAAAVATALCTQAWLTAAPESVAGARRQTTRIRARVEAEIDGVEVHGGGADDLPHILSVSVLYVDAETIQSRLDVAGYAVGSGSACASQSGMPSHVLAAIGGLTAGNIRIGLPPGLPDDVVDAFVDALVEVVARERAEMGTDGL
jgi:cysteine desulfurase